jgi:plastocyanin
MHSMKISFRITVLTAVAWLLACANSANATTFDVTVAPNGNLMFSPSSVTIHPGDTVRWTWGATFHSSTSGIPGAPNGIWDSGILSQGATFSHTFNAIGTFPYYCTPHGGCCGMVGSVVVASATPSPTSTPVPTPSPTPTPPAIADGCFPNFTTASGCDALSVLTTGAGNTALGWRSLFSDTIGSFNTAVGGGALALNNGDSNTAVGVAALLLNASGSNNTAVGSDTLVFNNSGNSNTATGYFALMNNTIGASNTALGSTALGANVSGSNNTAVGDLALQTSQTTSDNVAVGRMAGSELTTANNNVIIGHHSGVHSIFGQESDRCFIDNISGAPVSAATATVVMVDSDGRLGTVTSDGPIQGGRATKAVPPRTIPDTNQTRFDAKLQRLQETIAEQQRQIDMLTTLLKEQTEQLHNVNTHLEDRRSAVRTIAEQPGNNRK